MARTEDVTVKLEKGAHERLKFSLAVDPTRRGQTVKSVLTDLTDAYVARRLRKLGIGANRLAEAGIPVGAFADELATLA
jgi:recombinational DNA repair protein RecR